jgi:hypothetical protein
VCWPVASEGGLAPRRPDLPPRVGVVRVRVDRHDPEVDGGEGACRPGAAQGLVVGAFPPVWKEPPYRSRGKRREAREEASGTRLHVKAPRTPWSRHSPSLPLGQNSRSLRKSGDPASPILADALSSSEPTQSTRARLRACSSARADLEGGAVQPYAQNLVEALHSGGRHEPLGRRVYGYIGNPRFPLAACVARKALTPPRLEGVPHDPGPELVAQLSEQSPFLDSRVGVNHHYRTSCPQCGFYELPLPPVSVPIVAEQVLADVLMGGGKPLAEECALPREATVQSAQAFISRLP